MSKTECLPRETLKEYLAGWSDQEQSDKIEAHLAECGDCECEQAIAAMESDPDTLIDWIRHSSVDTAESEPIQSPSELAGDSNLAEAIERSQKMLPKLERPRNWTPPEEDIGMYELLRPLGCGGMGSVYLARHRKLNKEVAIKLLPARSFRKEFFAARFEREIRAAGELEHPAVVRATDAGEHEGIHYLVMEHIDGLDLSRLARRYGPLPVADACELMRSVALGLAHAHGRGIIHRDIKPSNLMLNQQGQTKILDFGLARVGPWEGASAELTTVGQLMGTLDYMAPEQAERPDAVDYRADLYSLGATLFRLLAGRAPLAASPDLSPLAKLRLMATHEAPRLGTLRSDAPEELVELVVDLLARDPAQRPPSADHVAERLEEFAKASELPQLLQAAAAMEEVADPAEQLEQMQLPAAGLASAPDQAATTAPQADMAGSGKRRIANRWLLAAMLPLMIFGGILIALETQKGQLVIQSEAEASVTLIKDGKVYKELKIVPGANSTRIYSGKYQVELAAGSDSLQLNEDSSIEVVRGGTVVASLAYRQPAAPLPGNDATLKPTGDVDSYPDAAEQNETLGQLFSLMGTEESRVEPVYEGKPLSHYLQTLAIERSSRGLGQAFVALRALVD
ncbi:MAG: serine/threonine-protein kinase, partial [Planctomycetota bacterium]